MEPPVTSLTCSPAVADEDAAPKEKEGALSQVDLFLVEALENPRHRLTVLRMELDIQMFMKNSDQYQFEFQPFPTSYLRCAAHRVAQHYGLQTMALDNNTIDGLGSRVIARKTPDSRFPAVCLSDVPTKLHEKERGEHVKIAIRPRASKALSSDDAADGGSKASLMRTVEERKEDYDKARARIFSGPDVEGGSPYMPSAADGRSSCSSGDELDGASRVAIFRDREKDRSDPDYDRSYDRYVRGLTHGQTLYLGSGCNVLQPPFVQYEAGYSQMGHLPMSYMVPSNPTMNHPFCAFGPNQTSKDASAVFMQWPNPAVMYANSYEHFRHAVFQAPVYHQPLGFEYPQNC